MRLMLCTIAAFLAAATAAGATSGPRVLIRDWSPLSVSGSGFDATAAVHVVAAVGAKKYVKVVRSTPTGTFTARWPASLRIGGCVRLTVSAASADRHATATAKPAQDCGALSSPVTPLP